MTNARKGLCGNEIWKCIIIYMDYSQIFFKFILIETILLFDSLRKHIKILEKFYFSAHYNASICG